MRAGGTQHSNFMTTRLTKIWFWLYAASLVALVVAGEAIKDKKASAAFAADVDSFIKRSDGFVIGVIGTNKTSVSLSDTVQEVTWGRVRLTNHLGLRSIVNVPNPNDLAKYHIKTMTDDGSITNVLNMVIADGTFCRVRGGHNWQGGCGMSGCLVNHVGGIRHCTVCLTVQTQEPGQWK